MRFKLATAAAAIFVLFTFAASSAMAQDAGSRLAHANGEGTLKIGNEQFKVNGVVVKLLDDGNIEITLLADITIFVQGTWAKTPNSQQDYDLNFTDASSRGGLDGTGKLTLGADNTGLRLNLKGKSRQTKKAVEVAFVGK
jgi:opacity protein-like surface antigen